MEGEKAEFTCSVSKDTYEVKWFRGDTEIKDGEKYIIISEGKRRALIVKNCDLKDEGGYVAHIGSVKASAELCVIGEMFPFFSTACRGLGWSLRADGNRLVFHYRKTEHHHSDQRHCGEGRK